jgi:hypothetical protein
LPFNKAFLQNDYRDFLVYFLVSLFLCLGGILAFSLLLLLEKKFPFNNGYQPIEVNIHEEQSDIIIQSSSSLQAENIPEMSPTKSAFNVIKHHFSAIFVTFLITLSLFPSITGAVLSTGSLLSTDVFVSLHFLV